MTSIVLRTLGAGGDRALKLATIVKRLAVDGGELGELETYQYLDRRGELATGRRIPSAWFVRLDETIEADAIDQLYRSLDRIVEIMMTGPR